MDTMALNRPPFVPPLGAPQMPQRTAGVPGGGQSIPGIPNQVPAAPAPPNFGARKGLPNQQPQAPATTPTGGDALGALSALQGRLGANSGPLGPGFQMEDLIRQNVMQLLGGGA